MDNSGAVNSVDVMKIRNKIKIDFDPVSFGWISIKTPPTTNRDVVVLVWLENETGYQGVFGFFENGEWHLRGVDDDKYWIMAWFPHPYFPGNE